MSFEMAYRPDWFERLLLALRVPRFDIFKTINGREEFYLRRFYLFKRSQLFWKLTGERYEGLYLHHVLRPDEDQHLHDHPWDFSALILAGGYREEIPDPKNGKEWGHGDSLRTRIWKPLSFRHARAEQFHRISAQAFKKTWTLFLVGAKRREWGFKTENGWVSHDDYLSRPVLGQASGDA